MLLAPGSTLEEQDRSKALQVERISAFASAALQAGAEDTELLTGPQSHPLSGQQTGTEYLVHNTSFISPGRTGKLLNHWGGPTIKREYLDDLKWNYLLEEKQVPYVGDRRWLSELAPGHPLYSNILAVFANARDGHEHGDLGQSVDGQRLWQPPVTKPAAYDSLSDAQQKQAMRARGFYEALSDALPVDRQVEDMRENVCLAQQKDFDVKELPDASIIITFVNEPLSTLLRTVHSVLNNSPSPLLREIILVDDHSNFADDVPGGPLYTYIQYLPKVKLMRLPERRGIVKARLAGARAAQGQVLVVLDSHIEVNPGWLEPQLHRIAESPQSLVFPQILGLSPTTFEQKSNSGIGCHVTWRWSVVEQSALTGAVTDTSPVASPSMAGGLFAISREFFWELGGYDEGFIAWGAENVEMAFRVWMCGGRVECTPCSKTYHIYRKGSTGYQNPVGALWTNRMRTARVWMDEYFQVAEKLIAVSANAPHSHSYGNLNDMLKLKKRLACKSFRWYLENVDPTHDLQQLDDVLGLGRFGRSYQIEPTILVRNTTNDQRPGRGTSKREESLCLDLNGSKTPPSPVKSYRCHSPTQYSGNQGFFIVKDDQRIRLMSNDKRCIAFDYNEKLVITQCNDKTSVNWQIDLLDMQNLPEWLRTLDESSIASTPVRRLAPTAVRTDSVKQWIKAKWKNDKCLTIYKDLPQLTPCDQEDAILWVDKFTPNKDFQLPQIVSSRLRGGNT
ncbi:glycosyltransferase-like family 2 protein [Gregarina niphandrodes]|uniref:Glycosyltransferase-like family 2 protein n=1 Tax=Gregarina niphandrodes TaxID=110365 RepID=A0A023B5X7_GRENI|nr:glycosyltransferase-like family 2 protein [Gregarina niphandrodes]EZG63626.1 glycosyltransferase-like family 2 protein [Gregarina niphandrodes]|eukprot:XP_011130666.1 glycosyltransferase-like family 2 protein [Gregarina niphandrodes]